MSVIPTRFFAPALHFKLSDTLRYVRYQPTSTSPELDVPINPKTNQTSPAGQHNLPTTLQCTFSSHDKSSRRFPPTSPLMAATPTAPSLEPAMVGVEECPLSVSPCSSSSSSSSSQESYTSPTSSSAPDVSASQPPTGRPTSRS